MDVNLIVNLTSRAWALPILAAMHDGVIGRQSRLLAATGASRTAFAQSLAHLIDEGLVERNPGHGHPLRAEFRLTTKGTPMATMASKINAVTPYVDHRILRRNWTLPILMTLQDPQHFNAIKGRLGRITDRALAQSLRVMEDEHWVIRRVTPDMRPPRPIYGTSELSHPISQITSAMH